MEPAAAPQGEGQQGEARVPRVEGLVSASLEELDAALIRRIRAVGRPGLAAGNPHLTDAELDLLVGSGRWPALDRPVLLPATGDRRDRPLVGLLGDQHVAARVACMARFCRDWQEAQVRFYLFFFLQPKTDVWSHNPDE
jgi:hypothetical protein